MFIELPPFSETLSDPLTAAEALFDLNTITLDAVRRGDGGRIRLEAPRAAREPADPVVSVTGAEHVALTFTP